MKDEIQFKKTNTNTASYFGRPIALIFSFLLSFSVFDTKLPFLYKIGILIFILGMTYYLLSYISRVVHCVIKNNQLITSNRKCIDFENINSIELMHNDTTSTTLKIFFETDSKEDYIIVVCNNIVNGIKIEPEVTLQRIVDSY